MRYQIELRYSAGWDDAGWSDETDGGNQPTRFSSLLDAQTALDKFFAEIRTAVAAGNMDAEADGADYRIIEARD